MTKEMIENQKHEFIKRFLGYVNEIIKEIDDKEKFESEFSNKINEIIKKCAEDVKFNVYQKESSMTELSKSIKMFRQLSKKDFPKIMLYKRDLERIRLYLQSLFNFFMNVVKKILEKNEFKNYPDFLNDLENQFYENEYCISMIKNIGSDFKNLINNQGVFEIDYGFKSNLSHWRDIIKSHIIIRFFDNDKIFNILKRQENIVDNGLPKTRRSTIGEFSVFILSTSFLNFVDEFFISSFF